MKIIIVLPTYNEAENLPKLVSALFELPLSDLRLLVVDDNSPDGTGRIADDYAAAQPGRISVRNPRELACAACRHQGRELSLERLSLFTFVGLPGEH